MKKVLFLMLFLVILGAVNVKAQVRIGGNTPPNPAAALDLNATDDATPAGNKGALALPRVSLASTTATLNGVTPVSGMLVYNTNASMTGGNGTGVYLWGGSEWRIVMTIPSSINTPVVWGISFHGLITFPQLNAIGETATASASGVYPGDVCVHDDTNYGEVMTTGYSTIWLVHIVGSPSNTQAAITCYRPYTLN